MNNQCHKNAPLVLIVSIISLSAIAQQKKINTSLNEANKLHQSKKYAQAEESYKKLLNEGADKKTVIYNLAATLYRQKKIDEASALYDSLIKQGSDNDFLSRVWYNKAVLLSNEDKLEESITAYRKALLLNPNDGQARENLQKALLELKKRKQNNPPPVNTPKPQASKLRPQEADQRLKSLRQKEKEVQEKVQQEKRKGGTSQSKDW